MNGFVTQEEGLEEKFAAVRDQLTRTKFLDADKVEPSCPEVSY